VQHPASLDQLLLEMVEALRDGFKLDAAELWLCEGGWLSLAAAAPPAQRDPITVSPAEESIAANARVSSAAWARVWLPGLLEGRPESTLRVAPIGHSGQLFGPIVAERASQGESLGAEADITLEEVAREMGVALNKARLDSWLQASLEQLRLRRPSCRRHAAGLWQSPTPSGGASSATFTAERSNTWSPSR
jgi:hypothetical protein